MFDEFAKVDGGPTPPPECNGLSLSLTRRLVEAQGGQVGARSTPGVGSTFFEVLDRVRPKVRPAGHAAARTR